MPLYDYQCGDCGAKDLRIGAIDDQVAICVQCGSLMLRLDDPFADRQSSIDEENESCNRQR